MFKYNASSSERKSNHIEADIIILGKSLPGLVTAYRLKECFGNTMEIMLLDLEPDDDRRQSEHVAFEKKYSKPVITATTRGYARNLGARRPSVEIETPFQEPLGIKYILAYLKDFKIELPKPLKSPPPSAGLKIFQYRNGTKTFCHDGYHMFKFVNMVGRFELIQLQDSLSNIMEEIYLCPRTNVASYFNSKAVKHYDNLTMENHIKNSLFMENSREIMRAIVRIICGTSADKVSVLFYLKQCINMGGSQQISSEQARVREKVLSVCQQKILKKLCMQTSGITIICKPVWQIRSFMNRQVILETLKGESNYVCNLLALALRPEQLQDIRVDSRLLDKRSDLDIILSMESQTTKKFVIQYEKPFWRENGFSGDILSLQGPIIWAMEKPNITDTGSKMRYHKIVGYLKTSTKNEFILQNAQEEVVAQLVRLFGAEAEKPISYKEIEFSNVYVPLCGDYVGLYKLQKDLEKPGASKKMSMWHSIPVSIIGLLNQSLDLKREGSSQTLLTQDDSDSWRYTSGSRIEWAALDLYGEGDLNASLEAGHKAYVSIMYRLRPQAQTFEDITQTEGVSILSRFPLSRYLASVNYQFTIHKMKIAIGFYVTYKLAIMAIKQVSWTAVKRSMKNAMEKLKSD